METCESVRMVRSVAWTLAIITLIFAILAHAVLWLSLAFGILCVVLLILGWLIYRPPEDHLAAVYFLGRFERWIPQHQWTLLIPWLEHIQREINLRPQIFHIVLPCIPTRDRVALSAEFNIRFQFDPRHVHPTLRATLLNLPPIVWETVVRDHLQLGANDIIGRFNLEQALDPVGYIRLGQRLSQRLAELLFPLGGVLDTQTSVSLLKLYPDETVQRAWQRKLASQLEGEADLARVAPILDRVARYPSRTAMNALLAEYAASIAAGHPPTTILNTHVTPSDGLPLNSLWRVLAEGDQDSQPNGKPGSNGQGKNVA